jgi:hypothetical protein
LLPKKLEIRILGLLGYEWEQLFKKILLASKVGKRKIAFRNSLCSQAQIEDLLLKCCILGNGPIKGRRKKSSFPLEKFALLPNFEDYTYESVIQR